MTHIEPHSPLNGSRHTNGLADGTSAEEVARRLGGRKAHRSGKSWVTCCPAHDDQNPSLSLSDGDNGELLVYCHAGCSQLAVIAALKREGIGVGRPSNDGAKVDHSGNIAALELKGFRTTGTYDYCDESGALLYQNVRLERCSQSGKRVEKTFRHRRPNPSGFGWIENLSGVDRVPYHLPELQRRAGENVHVTEGEKDADSLAKLGLLSTSIAAPALTSLEFLRGRRVYLHEDNDGAGRRKARTLANRLTGIANTVQIVRYADAGVGSDVTDWLNQGRDLEDLLERIEDAEACQAAPEVEPLPYESRCLAEVKPEPINWLWHERFACGKVSLIAGQPGLGKSQLAIFMAGKISIGGDWPDGQRCPQGSVILISCEDDAADTMVPRLMAVGADLSRVHTLDWVLKANGEGEQSKQLFDLAAHVPALASLVDRIGDVALIVVDPVSAYLGGIDSHKTSDVRGGLAPLQQLAAETGTAVVLISHLNKGSADANAMARVAGSGAFVAVSRSAWLVESDPQDESRQRRILTPLKNNIGDDQTGFAFQVKSVSLQEEIESSCILFETETVKISASELLRGHQESDEERGALGEATDFLKQYLADGPKNSKATQKAAEDAGVAPRTLRRAREKLKIKPHKSRVTSQWVWALPEHAEASAEAINDAGQDGQLDHADQADRVGQHLEIDQSSQLATYENVGQDGQLGHLGQGGAQ